MYPYRREGEHTRTTTRLEPTARTHGPSARALEVVETLRQPLPVPVAAIYSKTDGIVTLDVLVDRLGQAAVT
jgi:hypothetical protein